MPSIPNRLVPRRDAIHTIEDQQRMTPAKNYFAWLGRLVRPEIGQRVVEVGAGVGNFTPILLDRELVLALDLEPECAGLLRKRYQDRTNLQVFVSGVNDAEFADLAKFRPDSCVCLNVLEHVEDDADALSQMTSILVPGGVIVLVVPAFEALYGDLDWNLGHYRRYTRASMALLAQASGLVIRKMNYMNFAGFFGWWLTGRALRRGSLASWQIEFFDRYCVPLVAGVEKVVSPPFGQSLFVVLEKPMGR